MFSSDSRHACVVMENLHTFTLNPGHTSAEKNILEKVA
jgi:hypothetical protein